MIKAFYLFLFIPLSVISFVQTGGGDDPQANFIELFLGFVNTPVPNNFTFGLEKQATVWAANNNFEPPGFFINTDSEIDNSEYPWYVRDLESNWWR